MKCLILGGSGFIGSHLAEEFIDQGWDVAVFDRPGTDRNGRGIPGKAFFIPGDFLNSEDLSAALEGIDVVVHLVCTTVPSTSNDNPLFDVSSNVMGTIRLLDLIREKGVKRIVFASSGGTVYGLPRSVPIPEDHPTDPICSYGITKLAIEKYLGLYHHLYGLDYCALRIGNPFGEGQRPDGVQGVIAAFLKQALINEPVSIWGDGTVARDFLYIRDLSSAFTAAARLGNPVGIFNIGSGRAIALNEIVDMISEAMGRNLDVIYSPGRKLDVPVNYLDTAKAATVLGWKPEVTIKEGIRRTLDWMRCRA